MGRRSDHTREELRELLINHGHGLMEQKGLTHFSGRETAKRAGYSVGTIYNVFGSLDQLITSINSHTFTIWAEFLRQKLAKCQDCRITCLVTGYFDFATQNPQLWSAIYDHQISDTKLIDETDLAKRAELTTIVEQEVCGFLGEPDAPEIARYARSLIATVHGHCSFMLGGTFALLGESDPAQSAVARVMESLQAQGLSSH